VNEARYHCANRPGASRGAVTVAQPGPLNHIGSPVERGWISGTAQRPGADSIQRMVSTGTKAWELFADDPEVIAARVNGTLRDLAHVLVEADTVEPVTIDSADGHDILRHSTAHVMAQAVQELFPEARLGIGPPIHDGFYYDFDVPTPFVPEDLERLETRLRKIIKEGQRFSPPPIPDRPARAELADEPYKLELIGLKSGLDPSTGSGGTKLDQRE